MPHGDKPCTRPPAPMREPAKRSQFGAELPQDAVCSVGGADGKPPRVSCDPSDCGSMQRGFLRCRWRALTAPAQETGACRTPLTVFLPYRPTALVSAVSSIRRSLPQQEHSFTRRIDVAVRSVGCGLRQTVFAIFAVCAAFPSGCGGAVYKKTKRRGKIVSLPSSKQAVSDDHGIDVFLFILCSCPLYRRFPERTGADCVLTLFNQNAKIAL